MLLTLFKFQTFVYTWAINIQLWIHTAALASFPAVQILLMSLITCLKVCIKSNEKKNIHWYPTVIQKYIISQRRLKKNTPHITATLIFISWLFMIFRSFLNTLFCGRVIVIVVIFILNWQYLWTKDVQVT